jgi:hypothetical protein
MPSDQEMAETFRTRAEELRALADSIHDKFNRDKLKKTADSYDKMAEQLERKGTEP